MNIDNTVYKLPIVGCAYRRMHAYFRTQITATDIIHVLIGLGIGMVVGNQKFFMIGILALVLGAIYHIYAFINGNPDKGL